jgi:diguanylate cyclase (GGDEF)-like protein
MVSTPDENLTLLVVGDPRGALSVAALQLRGVSICEERISAIEAAAARPFTAIAVVISSFPDSMVAVVNQLHAANSAARLYLLARMYEEPQAISLMGSCRNGDGSFIADYLICPAEPAEIQQILSPETAAEAAVAPAASSELVEQLTRMATEDYLTQLKNRRYLDEFLVQIIDRARRTDTEVSLLVLDIDGLKHYNDTWGHTVGDSVLKQAAAFIKTCCRQHDIVARLGGDEFAVVFWDMPKEQSSEVNSAQVQDERRSANAAHPDENVIITRFRENLAGSGQVLLGPAGIGTLTMSGGLAKFPHDGANADELFLAADAALLNAKRSGKNRIYLVGQGETIEEGTGQ